MLFPPTASWATWSTVTVLVPLSAGTQRAGLPHRARTTTARSTSTTSSSRRATSITEHGVTLRIFNINTALQKLCDLKPGQTPNVDVLRPTIDWTTAADWENYSANYLAQVVADLDIAHGRRLHLPAAQRRRIEAVHRRQRDHRPRRRPRRHDEGRRRHAGGRLARARDPLLPGQRRRAAAAAVEAARPDHVRDGPELRAVGRGRRRPRRGAGIKECESAADQPGDGSPLTGRPPELHAEQPAPDAFRPDVSGIAWYPDGSAAVLTWGAAQTSSNGKLYRVTNLQGDVNVANVTYTEIATGLQEPQGVAGRRRRDLRLDQGGPGQARRRRRRRLLRGPRPAGELALREQLPRVRVRPALQGRALLRRAVRRAGPRRADDAAAALAGPRARSRRSTRTPASIEYIAGGLRTPNGINFGSERAPARDRQPGRLGSDEQARRDQARRLLQHVHDVPGPGHGRQHPGPLRQPAGHAAGGVDAAQRDRELPVDPGRHGGGPVRRAARDRRRHLRRPAARLPRGGRRQAAGRAVPDDPGPGGRHQRGRGRSRRRHLPRRHRLRRQLEPARQAPLRLPEAARQRHRHDGHLQDGDHRRPASSSTYTKPLSEETRAEPGREVPGAAVALQRHRGLRRSEARPGDAWR